VEAIGDLDGWGARGRGGGVGYPVRQGDGGNGAGGGEEEGPEGYAVDYATHGVRWEGEEVEEWCAVLCGTERGAVKLEKFMREV